MRLGIISLTSGADKSHSVKIFLKAGIPLMLKDSF